MTHLLIIMTSIYAVVGICVLAAVLLPGKKTPGPDSVDSVSIVIVAKDEEARLPAALDSLARLNTGNMDVEIILVDDRSQDATRDIMQAFRCDYGSVRVIALREGEGGLKGKKNGIARAVSAARGEIIFVTDADCVVSSDWIVEGVRSFSKSTGMSAGYVEKKGEGPLPMTEVEGAAGTLFAWAFARLGSPVYCSGGNMAFRRSAFQAVGGYGGTPDIASGDDTFLLRKISAQYAIGAMSSPRTFVYTDERGRDTNNIDKNRRRFSKNLDMRPGQVALFLFASLYHLLLIYAAVAGCFTILLPILVFKFIIEWSAFSAGAVKMGKSSYIVFFPLFAFYFPVKVIYYSFTGYLRGYRWKGEGRSR